MKLLIRRSCDVVLVVAMDAITELAMFVMVLGKSFSKFHIV